MRAYKTAIIALNDDSNVTSTEDDNIIRRTKSTLDFENLSYCEMLQQCIKVGFIINQMYEIVGHCSNKISVHRTHETAKCVHKRSVSIISLYEKSIIIIIIIIIIITVSV